MEVAPLPPLSFITSSIHYNNAINGSLLALLVVEYFENLQLEVSHIWTLEWGLPKVLYLLSRFLPFLAVTPMVLYYNVDHRPPPQLCSAFLATATYSIEACVVISEAILYMRVYALSGRNKRLLIFLLANGIVVTAVSVVLLGIFNAGAIWKPMPHPGVTGCFGRFSKGKVVVGVFVTFLYSGTMVMTLSVYFGIRNYWAERKNTLIKTLYRDGTFYFVAVAVLSIINGITIAVLPERIRFVVAPVQGVVHSIIATRITLHLREEGSRLGVTTTDQELLPSLEFHVPWRDERIELSEDHTRRQHDNTREPYH